MIENPLPPNAFPGLRPFETGEYRLFFGRDGQSNEISNRLRRNRFLAVVGTSGSGKSSLIRAGLLPALFEGFATETGSAWRVAVFRPGNNPIRNLGLALSDDSVFGSSEKDDSIQAMIIEAALRRSSLGLVETVRQARRPPDENLLIVVDQFEEIFRFKQTEQGTTASDEAAAFIKLLLEATRQDSFPIYVVITMRSDFLGDCAQFRDLPETLNDGQYLVPRMTRDQRREAIAGPIALCGGEIATRLLNRLLNDVGDNPDQLPILQHAMMRTWDFWKVNRTDGEPIDLRHYESIGGMDEALSRHADEAYGELPDDRSRRIAEILFKTLTEKGTDNREIRRPTRLSEICAVAEASEEEVIRVIEHFRRPGRSFLMPPSEVKLNAETLIDISHESLIRGWKTLRDWVDKEAESAAIYRRLAQTTALYEKGDAGLWRDPDLMLALEWREQNHPNKVWAQRYYANFDESMRFLNHSQRAKESQINRKEARRLREYRRRRNFVAALSIALVASLGLAVYAFKQKAIAEGAKQLAERRATEAKTASDDALQQKTIAEEARQLAETNAAKAERASDEALHQKSIAEGALLLAERKASEAKRASDDALRQKSIAEGAQLLAERKAAEAEEAKRKAEESENKARSEYTSARKQSSGLINTITSLADDLIKVTPPTVAIRYRRQKASALAQMGDNDSAMKEYNTALKIMPDDAQLLFERGSISSAFESKANESVADLERASKGNTSYLLHANLALAYSQLGRYEEAERSIDKAIQSFKYERNYFFESQVWPAIKGVTGKTLLFSEEDEFRVALLYEKANIRAVAGGEGFITALKKANEAADVQRAPEDVYLTALNMSWLHKRPEDYGGLVTQGALWERFRKPDLARCTYSDFIDKHKKGRNPRYDALARWVERRLDEIPKSGASDCTKLFASDEVTPDVRTLAVEADVASALNRWIEADNLLSQASKQEPNNIGLLIQRAQVLYSAQRYAECLELCNSIVKLAPQTPMAYLLRALSKYELSTKREEQYLAASDLEQTLKYDPGNLDALQWLGKVSEENDQPEKALVYYERVLELAPDLVYLYPRIARLQLAAEHYDQALKSIESAIANDLSNFGLYEERSEIQRKLGVKETEVQRNLAGGFAEAGDALHRLGKDNEALDAYGKSLDIFIKFAKDQSPAEMRCDLAQTISKISKELNGIQSKQKAIEFWQTVVASGQLKSYEELLQTEIRRLANSP